jgi:hypothetical protein
MKKLLGDTPETAWLNVATRLPASVAGLVKVTVVGPVTLKQPVHVLVPWSALANVTFRDPVAAPPAMSMLTVRCDPVKKVTELTVMPVPENATVVPGVNPTPITVRLCPVRPLPFWGGVMLEAAGPAWTVKQPIHVAVP